MIVPYASDEENERSKDEYNLHDKDIKICTPEVSLDNVRNDNLFAFDVKKLFNLNLKLRLHM
jgi:hypothetical protein